MKTGMCLIVLALFFVTGCQQAVTGIADAQDKFLEAKAVLDAETAKMKATVEGGIIKPETKEAAEDVVDRVKDPFTWMGLASLLANAFLAGRILRKKP